MAQEREMQSSYPWYFTQPISEDDKYFGKESLKSDNQPVVAVAAQEFRDQEDCSSILSTATFTTDVPRFYPRELIELWGSE